MANLKEEVDISKIYGESAKPDKGAFVQKNNIKLEGLTNSEAEERIKKQGFNEIKQARPKKWYNYFLESLITPFNSILIGIVIILLYTDVYLAEVPSYANIIVIIILVTASTLLDFFEEFSDD